MLRAALAAVVLIASSSAPGAAAPGNFRPSSIPELKRALARAQAAGNAGQEEAVLDQLAEANFRNGEWNALLDYAQRAYERIPAPDDRARGRYKFRRCVGLLEMREVDAAEQSCREALDLALGARDVRLTAEVTGHLGYVLYRGRRRSEEGRRLYEQALDLARRAAAPELEARFLNLLGNIDRADDPRRSRALYEEGLRATERAGGPRATLLKNLGITMFEMHDTAGAERVLLEARAEADREDWFHARWQSRMELGRVLSRSDPARAGSYFAESLDVLESKQNNVFLEDYRAGAITGAVTIYDDPYDLYIHFLLGQGREEEAFHVAERARARAYLDSLTGVRDALAATVPPGFVAAERAALERISEHQAALRTRALDEAQRQETLRALRAAEEELQGLRMRLATTHPAAAQVRDPHFWTMAEMQQRVLREGEALIAFYVGASASARWLVRPGLAQGRTLPPQRELEAVVRDYVNALHTPGTDVREHARRVYEVLLGDAAAELRGVRRLIVVPGGILHSLPFEALEDESGAFLAERYVVSYAPSASSYATLRTQPRRVAGRGLLAIGDPLGAAPGEERERGLSVEQVDLLKPLPHAGAELAEVAASCATSRVLDRANATEAGLQQAGLEQALVLHFATHGLVDEEHPERSGLALTAAPGSDGILQMREIYRLRLSADLVTLSACRTAVGRELTGEGVMGLGRAFLYAGAGAVMASLWNVNDASTSAFMGRFYGQLRRGRTVAEASREAKLALLRDRRWSHPYYWAPFVVTGNAGVPVPLGGGSGPWWPAAVAAAVAFGTAGTLLLGRRRRRVR